MRVFPLFPPDNTHTSVTTLGHTNFSCLTECMTHPEGSGSGPAGGGCCRGFPPSAAGGLELEAVVCVTAAVDVEEAGDEEAAVTAAVGHEEMMQETSAGATSSSPSPTVEDTSRPSPLTVTHSHWVSYLTGSSNLSAFGHIQKNIV